MEQMFLRFTKKMRMDKVRAHAAEAAFFIIMSFFPVLMILLALIRFTPLSQEQILFTLEQITPFTITPFWESAVQGIFGNSAALLPWTVLAALWSGGKGVMGLADGLNSIFQIEETKNYFVTRIRAAFYTIILVLALVLSLGILVFGYWIQEFMKKYFPLVKSISNHFMILPMAISMVLLIGLFWVLYVFVPNRRQSFKSQFPGAVFTAVSWSLFSYAFSIYLEFAVNMTVIYGSLTTLVVVMLWLYSCMYLLFIGAEINEYIRRPELFT